MDLNTLGAILAIISVLGLQIGTYYVLRYRVTLLEKNFSTHIEDSTIQHKEETRRLEASFKRIDTLSDRITILERDTKSHLDLPTAEVKFVSKAELELHLKNIETITTNTNKLVDSMMGKMDMLTSLLSQGISKKDN